MEGQPMPEYENWRDYAGSLRRGTVANRSIMEDASVYAVKAATLQGIGQVRCPLCNCQLLAVQGRHAPVWFCGCKPT